MKNATNAMLCWNINSSDVALVVWPDPANLSGNYQRTGLACWKEVRKSSFEVRKAQVFIEAMHLIVRDKCDPEAVHRALLGLEEYRDGLAEDMPGA